MADRLIADILAILNYNSVCSTNFDPVLGAICLVTYYSWHAITSQLFSPAVVNRKETKEQLNSLLILMPSKADHKIKWMQNVTG
jgi:hypothetical protein